MKPTTLLFCLVVGLIITGASLSVAQVVVTTDTVFIPGGASNAGLLEATINGDTTAAGLRKNPMRVYKLTAGTIYTQNAAISIQNPTGVLTIVGGKGGTKPVILLVGKNGVDPGMNTVQGSIKLRNIYMCAMITSDGLFNNNLWIGSTANKLPQFVDCEDCMFEFIQLDTFSCDAYTNGAKFRFSNCYFRNLFNGSQWWGGRVFYCKQYIDTVIVENCTVTCGGLTFLNQNSLTKYAYYNHNTIINNDKYWQLGVYYLEGYWTNNLFINQNWVGEDLENVATGGQDPDYGMLMGTFGIDTLTVVAGKTKRPINIQPEFLLPDSTIDPAKCGLDKIKAFVSNNILWQDTVMMEAYYKNKAVGGFGPYGTSFVGQCPVSMLNWSGSVVPPSKVVNAPGIWMNPRTTALFNKFAGIKQKDNFINVKVTTVTPAIKDAATANQMALWNAAAWGVTGLATNDLLHSAYITGDYDATTVPGIKTEDGLGIAKYTDLTENYAQTGTVKKSTIDNLPIGALHWVDADIAAYNSATAKAAVMTAYAKAVGVETSTSGLPESFELSQNYPNPFNPTTNIDFALAKASDVKLSVYNLLGQKVMTLVDSHMSAGKQSVVFDASKLTSGVYFYRLDAGNFSSVKKMLLVK